jgi:hypothetical protein
MGYFNPKKVVSHYDTASFGVKSPIIDANGFTGKVALNRTHFILEDPFPMATWPLQS